MPEERVVFKRTNASNIIIVGENAALFAETKAFQLWMNEQLDPRIEMDHLQLRDTFVVGKNNMLFATVLGVKASLKGKPISAYAFLRSNAVAMLSLIEAIETGEMYAVITEQCRFPFGGILHECPAGMLDDAKEFTGVAAKEIAEELQEKATADKLIHLGDVVMSGGGCSEKIHFVLFKMEKSQAEIASMRGRKTGSVTEKEDITLHILPFSSRTEFMDNLFSLNLNLDAKMLSALALYDYYLAKGGKI